MIGERRKNTHRHRWVGFNYYYDDYIVVPHGRENV